MSLDRVMAISLRIMNQIWLDHRSLAMIIVAPIIVMSLVGFSFADQRGVLDRVAPALMAVFSMFFTFILTGVSFLRERSQGTLERLMTTTVGRADILVGYLLGFMIFATVQTIVILFFTIFALRVEYQGNVYEIIAVLMAIPSQMQPPANLDEAPVEGEMP